MIKERFDLNQRSERVKAWQVVFGYLFERAGNSYWKKNTPDWVLKLDKDLRKQIKIVKT